MSFEIFINATAQVFNVPEKFTIESWAANSANLFCVGLNGIFVYFAISLTIFLSKPFFELIPVPTAVPPWARKYISLRAYSILAIHFFNWIWYPENSCPSDKGVASCRWVLPILTIFLNSFSFFLVVY